MCRTRRLVLGGLALALSRLIEALWWCLKTFIGTLKWAILLPSPRKKAAGRWLCLYSPPRWTTVVVFFPVTLVYGVSKFLFSSLAIAVVLSLFASYFVAMTVVPLFCARFLKHAGAQSSSHEGPRSRGIGQRFNAAFNHGFGRFLGLYDRLVGNVLARPVAWLVVFAIGFAASMLLFPQLELSFFPEPMPADL